MTPLLIILILGIGVALTVAVLGVALGRARQGRRSKADPYATPFGDVPRAERCICHEHHPVCICRPSALAPVTP